jgi:hypothetical protein
MPEKPLGKESTLIELFIICIEIMKDETMLNALYEMIDHCTQGRGTPIA